MPAIDIECPSCGVIGKVDEGHVGKTIKCRSCGNRFVVEVGETYGLVEPPPSRPRVTPTGSPRGEASSPPEESREAELPKSWLEMWPTD